MRTWEASITIHVAKSQVTNEVYKLVPAGLIIKPQWWIQPATILAESASAGNEVRGTHDRQNGQTKAP